MVPTLAATLGGQGHRPTGGTRDGKDLRSEFAAVNLVTAAVPSNTLESPKYAMKKTGLSKTRRMPAAFADHWRHIGRVYPREKYPRVVLLIDNASCHRGQPIHATWGENPHREFQRLPSYRPQWNPIERFWKKLRRRATHNRLFNTLTDLKASIRNRVYYFQTLQGRIRTRLERSKRKQTLSSGL